MAFPAVHYGSFGDEKETSAAAKIGGYPLGYKMVYPDGREFLHARIGGTAAIAGRLYQSTTSAVSLADTMYAKALVPAAVYAVGATTVAFTTGGTTAVATDRFAEGYLVTASSTGTGIGYMYKIKSNNSAASGSTTCTITLYETDGLKVATNSASTRFGIIESKYSLVEVTLAGTVGHPIVGVACNSAAASAYVWLQTKGAAPVYSGTVLRDREPVVCSTATAGAVTPISVAATSALLATKQSFDVVGIGLASAEITGYAMVDLKLS